MIAARSVALAVVLATSTAAASPRMSRPPPSKPHASKHSGHSPHTAKLAKGHGGSHAPKALAARPATQKAKSAHAQRSMRLAQADLAPRQDERLAESESAGTPGYAPRAPAADGLGLDDEGTPGSSPRGSRVVRHSIAGETSGDDRIIR